MHRHDRDRWRFLSVERVWGRVYVFFLCHDSGEVFRVRSKAA